MASSFRASVERASLPVLTRLSAMPRFVPFLLVLGLMVAGILVHGWGWVLIVVVVIFIGWILFLSWPRLTGIERLMRSAVLLLAAAVAATRAFPQS